VLASTSTTPKFVVFYETTQLKANANHDGTDLAFRHEGQTLALLSDGSVLATTEKKKLNFRFFAELK
jgi:hypothetical protein